MTCGTCKQWQLINVQQLVDYPSDRNRPFDTGRCRYFSVARYRGGEPMANDCHVAAGERQEYSDERK